VLANVFPTLLGYIKKPSSWFVLLQALRHASSHSLGCPLEFSVVHCSLVVSIRLRCCALPISTSKLNAWVFGDTRSQLPVERLANRILDELQLWMMARRGTGLVMRDGVGIGVGDIDVRV
jgi:hypothetical protein